MSNLEKPAASVGVNLDRNLSFDSGLEYNKDHFYRMIGESGYDDFLDTGFIQAKADSKQQYDKAYYFKGQPLNRYSSNSRVNYFVEVKPTDDLFSVEGEAGYPFSTRHITSNDEIRIYRHSASDGVDVVFDSFKT